MDAAGMDVCNAVSPVSQTLNVFKLTTLKRYGWETMPPKTSLQPGQAKTVIK